MHVIDRKLRPRAGGPQPRYLRAISDPARARLLASTTARTSLQIPFWMATRRAQSLRCAIPFIQAYLLAGSFLICCLAVYHLCGNAKDLLSDPYLTIQLFSLSPFMAFVIVS